MTSFNSLFFNASLSKTKMRILDILSIAVVTGFPIYISRYEKESIKITVEENKIVEQERVTVTVEQTWNDDGNVSENVQEFEKEVYLNLDGVVNSMNAELPKADADDEPCTEDDEQVAETPDATAVDSNTEVENALDGEVADQSKVSTDEIQLEDGLSLDKIKNLDPVPSVVNIKPERNLDTFNTIMTFLDENRTGIMAIFGLSVVAALGLLCGRRCQKRNEGEICLK
jgi:hypothetical protein